jgi:site-specific DNA-cytosine methylase
MIPRAVYEMRPRVVTIENVRGYLKSPVYAEIKEKLELQGYKLFEKIVNCKHLGVPQNRERLIVVGLLEGSYTFPEDDRIIGWYNVIEDLLNDCPDSHLAPWQIRRLDNVLNNGLVNDDSKQKRPVPFEKPCPTIMTTGSGGNFKALLIDNFNYDLIPDYQHCRTLRASKQGLLRFLSQDTSGIKALTPRCLARLMSLSDDYILPDSKTLATKVIGNGFPPEAMFRILENL